MNTLILMYGTGRIKRQRMFFSYSSLHNQYSFGGVVLGFFPLSGLLFTSPDKLKFPSCKWINAYYPFPMGYSSSVIVTREKMIKILLKRNVRLA